MPEHATLDAHQWDRIADCFERALELPESDRASFIAEVFADDAVARGEVLAILAEHSRGEPLSIESWLVTDASTAASGIPIGTRIGTFRVGERIGQGGMGEVYRGDRDDGTFEQAVAIKVLRAGLGSQELVRRFQTERRILGRLAHPSIVGIIDGGTTPDGRPYLVMPYVEGLPLIAYCDQQRLSLDDRLRLFERVAAAVQYAHVQLVVHRDIKPSNILVSPSGEVHLLDFGIAKMLAAHGEHTGGIAAAAVNAEATQSAMRLLTPEHAAPEQVRGESVSTATDVYGLGVLLYELLTGTKPHRLDSRAMIELERDILEREPQPPSAHAAAVPWGRRLRGDLDRIVLKALRKEPLRRYSSVGQFADDIARYLKGLPVSAERDRFGYRFRKFVRRNRVGVAAGSLVALLLVAFAGSMSWQARQLARERDRVTSEKAATESVVALLTSLFARANPVTVPGGDTLRVQQLLAAGDTLVDSLDEQPYLQARMWRVLGTMHYARGRVDAAEELLQRAYDRMMSIRGADSLEVAQTYHELARAVEAHQGKPKAMSMFATSVERLRRAPGVSEKDIMIAERELAERSNSVAESRRALEALVAKKTLRTANDSMEYAASLNALASERYGSGQMRDAVVLFTETLRYLELLLPDGHPNRLIVAGNVSMARRDYGEFEMAEGLARQVLTQQRTQVTENPIAVAGAIERLASTQAMRGFLEDAERGYREARRIENDLLPPTHSMRVYNAWSLAFIVDARGRAREASLIADSAIRLARQGGLSPMDTLTLTDLRALFLMHQEQWQPAERLLLPTGPRMRALAGGPHMSIDSHETWLGMLALGQARYAAAIQHFTDAAAGKRARVLASHPDIAGDDCGRGIAFAKLGRSSEAAPLLRDACSRYLTLGTHSRLIARWAAEVQ